MSRLVHERIWSMANQFLSLSLFLMLLSFFIIMNAVSDFDETKAQPVLNSLSIAFSNETIEISKSPAEVEPNFYEELREGDALESMEGLFNAHISGFEARRNRLGTMMHVRVPIGRFENAIDINGFADLETPVSTSGSFVQTMIALLRSNNNGVPYRMDMVLNMREEPLSLYQNNQSAFLVNLRRMSALAVKLETLGLPKKMLSAGLSQGEEGYLDLFFYKYKPFELPDVVNEDAPPDGNDQGVP